MRGFRGAPTLPYHGRSMQAPQYPVLLSLEGRATLVVGGGPVAARKAAALVRCGARVTVVAPELCPAMERLVAGGGAVLARRPFVEADAQGCLVAIAATDDDGVNREVGAAARRRGALVNVVDQPELCDFTAPSVLRRGPLAVAVSTSGASPALARRVRKMIGELLGPEWAVVARALGELRRRLLSDARIRPAARRRALLAAAELDLATIARQQGRAGVEAALKSLEAGAPRDGA